MGIAMRAARYRACERAINAVNVIVPLNYCVDTRSANVHIAVSAVAVVR